MHTGAGLSQSQAHRPLITKGELLGDGYSGRPAIGQGSSGPKGASPLRGTGRAGAPGFLLCSPRSGAREQSCKSIVFQLKDAVTGMLLAFCIQKDAKLLCQVRYSERSWAAGRNVFFILAT